MIIVYLINFHNSVIALNELIKKGSLIYKKWRKSNNDLMQEYYLRSINILLSIFKIRKIDIFILHCVTCSELLLLCFPEEASMNTFHKNQTRQLISRKSL